MSSERFSGGDNFTGLKKMLHDVMMKNELNNGRGAYEIKDAQLGKSGWSYGPAQWDLSKGGKLCKETFKKILEKSETEGILKADNVDALYQAAINHESLNTDQKNLINKSLSSDYGRQEINKMYSSYLDAKIDKIDKIIKDAPKEDKTFLSSDFAKLVLIDFDNQFEITPDGQMERYIQGQSATFTGGTISKEGVFGLDDLLRPLVNTKYFLENSHDPIRRFNSVWEVAERNNATPPIDDSNALGIITLFENMIEPRGSAFLGKTKSEYLDTFIDKIAFPAIKVIIQEEGDDQVADNFIPPELNSSQLFFLPNDSSLYVLSSDGKIIKSIALASTDGGGEYMVINADNLPATREELLAQLRELGVPEAEAKSIADGSELAPNNYAPEESTVFGLAPELWAAMTQIAAAAQDVEQVGDDVTALIQAFQQGNDWDAFAATVKLLKSLDTVAGLSESYKELTGEVSGTIEGTSSLISAIGDIIRLEQAMQDDDEWAIASSATSMVDNGIEAYNQFTGTPETDVTPRPNGAAYSGAAASIVGLGLSVKEMTDAFEDGDAIARIQATLNVVQSSLSTYVAVSQASAAMSGAPVSAATQSLGNALPAIGCAIGVAQGVLAIADGDVQGGSEQIALAVATYILIGCGPYGWIVALALQLGSATRNCDGQIIDTENIEHFSADIAPGGDVAAEAAIASIEKPAEWGTDVYEGNLYFSGANVDMYAELGVEIPEDMHGEFGFVQANAEFFNPLRYAQYFQDLDEMKLGDIWDSLYISQSIAATIAQIKGLPDFVKSVFNDTPDIAKDLLGTLKSPGKILGMAKYIFGNDDPPQASVHFTLDENGEVAKRVGGDKIMLKAADSYADSVIKVMMNYRENGGRLEIDGTLPSLHLVKGGGSTIDYRSQAGGQVSVMLGDMANSLTEMQSALYARDRGDRLDSAVDVSRDWQGDIDLAQVDRIMAGYGFKKNGLTYTYGETRELTGVSRGSGVFNGGGNVGPQGQHFAARNQDIKSLPLRDDQRPSQTMGEIIKVVGMNNAFAGAGAELLAMAMISGGLLGLAAPAGAAANPETASENLSEPLDHVELEKYLHNLEAFPPVEEKINHAARPQPMPATTDAAQMQQFLEVHWDELLENPERFAGIPESAYFYRQPIGYHDLRSDGSRPGSVGFIPFTDDPVLWQRMTPQGKLTAEDNKEVKVDHFPGQSFTGHRVNPESPPPAAGGAATGPGRESGPIFIMAEDTSLRFLLSDLLEDTVPGSYAKSEDSCSLVSFGPVENGRVCREADGDIRFEPTPGFVGTGSFLYTVRNSAGELLEKMATVQVENVNDSPQLMDDAVTLTEGQPFSLDELLANDRDPEGQPLALDQLRGLEHGEVALVDGRLTFLPEAGYHGEVTFSYWVCDQAFAYPAMATAILTYVDLDTAPAAGDDRFLVMEDDGLTVTVDELLANDIEYDGENVAFAGLFGAAYGTVTQQPDGTILFTPAQDYAGTAAGFGYRVTDDSGHEVTGWVAVEVLGSSDAPVVVSATRAPIAEDEALIFTPAEVAGFVHDADGDQLHLDFITNVTGGTIITANGCYSFVPDPDYAGPASFDYRANDNHRGMVDGHLAFDILPVNDPVRVGQDFLVSREDQEVAVTIEQLLANDHDADGAVITFTGLGASAFGSVALGQNDTIVFTPQADYAGSDAGFAYRVQYAAGLRSTGWVQVRVDNVNDAPAITVGSIDVREDRPLAFDAATLAGFVRDADDDTLRVAGMAAVSGGTVARIDSLFTFTPNPNYHGTGTLELTIADQHGAAVSAAISLNIIGSDDPATLGAHCLTTAEEEGVSMTISSLLAGDHDEDGPLDFIRLGQATHGMVQVTSSGEIRFTPDQDYFGDAAGFDYVVRDPDGYEAVGRVAVKVENVNDAPRIVGNALVAGEDQPVIFNAATLSTLVADPDGDAIRLTAVSGVTGGTIEAGGGIFTFIPDQDYHGPASLGYSAEDGRGGLVSGQVEIELVALDDPTDFGDAAFATQEEQPLKVSIAELMANDTDGDGPLEFLGLGAAQHGEARVAAGGMIEFVPGNDYFGDDAGFTYRVRDAEGHQAIGRARVAVEGVNDVPIILADRLHLREDQAITFDANETAKFLFDGDGDLLHLDLIENVAGGSILQAGGISTFVPDQDFYGEASFDYLATNSQGEELAGKLAIAIAPVNDLPEIAYFSATGIEDNEVTMTVAQLMAGAIDVEDGANLRFAGIDSSLQGAVFVDSDRIVHFLPDKDFFGSGFFRYAVTDSEGGLGIGFVAIELTGENDAPVAVDDDRILAWSDNCYGRITAMKTSIWPAGSWPTTSTSMAIRCRFWQRVRPNTARRASTRRAISITSPRSTTGWASTASAMRSRTATAVRPPPRPRSTSRSIPRPTSIPNCSSPGRMSSPSSSQRISSATTPMSTATACA